MVSGCPSAWYKVYEGLELQLHAFLTWELGEGGWSALYPSNFAPAERATSIHWLVGCVGPSLDVLKKEKMSFAFAWKWTTVSVVQPVA